MFIKSGCAKGAALLPAESPGTLEVNTSRFWGSRRAEGGGWVELISHLN